MDYLKKLRILINNQTSLDTLKKDYVSGRITYIIDDVLKIEWKIFKERDLIHEYYKVSYKGLQIDLNCDQRKHIYYFASEKYNQLMDKQIAEMFK
jgi:hypothetical protein